MFYLKNPWGLRWGSVLGRFFFSPKKMPLVARWGSVLGVFVVENRMILTTTTTTTTTVGGKHEEAPCKHVPYFVRDYLDIGLFSDPNTPKKTCRRRADI